MSFWSALTTRLAGWLAGAHASSGPEEQPQATPDQAVLESICRNRPIAETLHKIAAMVAVPPNAAAAIHLRCGDELILAASAGLNAQQENKRRRRRVSSAAGPDELIHELSSAGGELIGRLTEIRPAGASAKHTAPPTAASARRMAAIAIEQHNLMRELQFRATHDSLTGFRHRSALPDLMLEPQGRAAEEPWTLVLFLDLDGLGRVNEILGTPVGDALLRETALRIRRPLGPSDEAVRCGGDEFLIVLRGVAVCPRPSRPPTTFAGQSLIRSISMGSSFWPPRASASPSRSPATRSRSWNAPPGSPPPMRRKGAVTALFSTSALLRPSPRTGC